jgi:acyl carrier protein
MSSDSRLQLGPRGPAPVPAAGASAAAGASSAAVVDLGEEEFIARARRFLSEVGGKDASAIDPDANLVDNGILDSLLLIAFLAFVEEQRGYEMEIQEADIKLLATLRTAYRLACPGAAHAAAAAGSHAAAAAGAPVGAGRAGGT